VRHGVLLCWSSGHPISELPEPEVFGMMLVGLILLGYWARRDSSEKFK
jgi:hypothetical protein